MLLIAAHNFCRKMFSEILKEENKLYPIALLTVIPEFDDREAISNITVSVCLLCN